MRKPSLLNGTSTLSRRIWSVVTGSVALVAALKPTNYLPITQPVFDIQDLGRIGLAGDFSAVSLFEYAGQAQTSPFLNNSHSLLTQLPNGVFVPVGLADGGINAMCVYELEDGTSKGIVVGGNFTSLLGQKVGGIALYNPQDDTVAPMGDFEGKVYALLCDKITNRVYVGGQFSMGNSENAMAWEDGAWKDLPFEGFSDPVNIISRSNNDSIIFGGSFGSLRNFSEPTTKHAQTLNIVSAAISAQKTTLLTGFDDPSAITCTNDTSKQWLLEDNQQGSWEAEFQFEFKPTKLRLVNANHEGRGTKIFRFVSFPSNGIMNMTYVDPDTKQKKFCDAWCPLAQSDDAQDFEFVNRIGMKTIRLEVYEWYGKGGGFSSVQLFQDDIFSYAITGLNEPACTAPTTRSNSTNSGKWDPIQRPGTDAYVTSNVAAGERASSAISFVPHIEQTGRYEVLMYTPGCINDGSCAQRGSVEVTGVVTKDGAKIPSFRIFQTNNFDKYDKVYEGLVDAADGAFRPTITLTPTADQVQSTVNIVAQKVQFKMKSNSTTPDTPTSTAPTTPGSSQLNGLYEFNTRDNGATNPADSATSSAGLKLKRGAAVSGVVVVGDVTYIGGNFTETADNFRNFFALEKSGNIPSVPEGGLNGPVEAILPIGDLLYIGGSFTQSKTGETKGISGICAFNTVEKKWLAIGEGVEGSVSDIVAVELDIGSGIEQGIALSGKFSRLLPSSDASNFAVWVPSQGKWLAAIEGELAIAGVLSASVKSGDIWLYSGSIASNTMSSSGTVYLMPGEKTSVAPTSFKWASTNPSSSRKRAVADHGISGISTGHFYVENGKNLTILGGKFQAQGKDGEINALAFIDGDSGEITGATTEFTKESTILALANLNTDLFVGGSLEGVNKIGGIAKWDLATGKLSDEQPPGLGGVNATVYSITARPDTQDVYVVGDFETAGSLTCRNICLYSNAARQWEQATAENPGVIYMTKWVNADTLLVGGDMKLNNTATYLALFDAKTATFKAYNQEVNKIPGPVQHIALDSEGFKTLFISGISAQGGKPYIMKLTDEQTFVPVEDKFGPNTVIKNIQILGLQNSHADGIIDESKILLVAGSLDLVDFGNASAVTYDGSQWSAMLLTSRADGEPGTISAFFSLYEPKFSEGGSKMARGFVILISLAIALALVFLIVVCGVLASYLRRRSEGYVPAPTMAGNEKSVAMQGRLPPQELFQHGTQRGGAPMI